MATKPLPDHGYLRECFDYDPLTGVLRWLTRPLSHFPDKRAQKIWNTKNAGNQAGSMRHATVGINDHPRFIHRVIWKWMTREEPPEQIDHHDQDYTNYRWDNLRAAGHEQNQQNRGAQKNNRLGLKGVSTAQNGTYYARATVDGVPKRLGTFATAQEAHEAYCAVAKEQYGEFWSPGNPKAKRRRIMARVGSL